VLFNPNIELLPESLKPNRETPEEQIVFSGKMVIDYTYEHCAAFNLTSFFESVGPVGLAVFQ